MLSEWSKHEKIVARKAFDLALARRNQQLIEQVNNTHAKSVDEVWALLEVLQTANRDMQRVFDFRYSQLDLVFLRLIHDGLLSIAELEGLGPERLKRYQAHPDFLNGRDAD
ncbi:MAG: hypothetical protein HOP02_10500 [Methylococcaceae bacterium]|nr:hypothetical protein [Methylococcaceae bacterium]